MTRVVSWLAVLYVGLLPVGRSGLPLNAQWGDLLLPLLVAAVLYKDGSRRWMRARDWPIAVYLTVTLATAALSSDPLAGLKQLVKQMSVVLIFLVFRYLAHDSVLTRKLQAAFAMSMGVVTLVSLVVVFLRFPTGVPPSTLGEGQVLPLFGLVRRLRGLFEAPEMLGNALLVAFVLALGLRASSSRARILWTIVAAVLFAGEFLTYSHSVAGFSVAAAMFVGPMISARALRALGWAAALTVVGVVNVASIIDPRPPSQSTHYEIAPVSFEFLGARVEGSLMSYAALKRVAWGAFVDHPLTGIGPGRFTTETERAFEEGRLTARYRAVPPHSDLFGRLAEAGLVGGLSLLVLWAFWISRLRPGLLGGPPQRAACAAVVGLLVNSLNADVMNFRFLWLSVAWVSVPAGLPEEGPAQTRRREPSPAASVPTGP